MNFFDTPPFSKLIQLESGTIHDLLLAIPKVKSKRIFISKIHKNLLNSKEFILSNWNNGSHQFSDFELINLSKSDVLKLIENKLIDIHKLKNTKLKLKSACIFYPDRCRYIFNKKKEAFIFHKYHVDSSFKIKALIMLDNSKNETQQFSYIKRFPEALLAYYIKRHFYSKIMVFLQKIIYYFTLKLVRPSGHPPELPIKYQNKNLYKIFSNLKFGQMITFHNLYPHSSHNGTSNHITPMLQLVFDI